MTTESHGRQLRELLEEAEAMRDGLRERRGASPYPWDPTPVDAYNRLLGRARAFLPDAPVDLPEPLPEGAVGARLWRTPTDDALDALENLRAALRTALKADQPDHGGQTAGETG